MMYRLLSLLLAAATFTFFGPVAKADEPQELRTETNKPVAIGNLLSAPNDCGTNPGPSPIPILREKPSHGSVRLQIALAEIAATDACPARKIPSIILFYTPNKDFVGKDSLKIEFESTEAKVPLLNIAITVQDAGGK
jgi:hypothetical protein